MHQRLRPAVAEAPRPGDPTLINESYADGGDFQRPHRFVQSHGLRSLSRDNNVQPLRKGRGIKRLSWDSASQGHAKNDSKGEHSGAEAVHLTLPSKAWIHFPLNALCDGFQGQLAKSQHARHSALID
jgi:hypothetical protein